MSRAALPAVTTGDKWPTYWAAVVAVFPDICPEYAQEMAAENNWSADAFISRILDNQETGVSYPTRAPVPKRKRDDDNLDEGEEDKREAEATVREDTEKFLQKREERARKSFDYLTSYTKAASFLLQGAFPRVYVMDIATVFKENQSCLYRAYLALRDEFAKPEGQNRFMLKKAFRPTFPWDRNKVHERSLGKVDAATKYEAEQEALTEFSAIHDLHLRVEQRKTKKEDAEARAEQANYNKAQAEGTIAECGCCYIDVPRNRMVHCNGETPHYFCYICARSLAETQIGLSKHELKCMSPDNPDCAGVFNQSQKNIFLDKNLITALDRIEGSAVLRMAGIESLETCPFCPYAAEYPPTEENKEFICENPECGVVSCRLCRGRTHIPKSCDEVKAMAAAQSKRHDIEEAMTQALIRKCNKCGTPFIKTGGCNKMRCTNCQSAQCYICSETIKDYSHFNKPGGCQLNDQNLEAQHAQRVNEAETAARQKVLNENPEFKADHLQFNFSKTVQDEEAKKWKASERLPVGHAHPPAYVPPYAPPPPRPLAGGEEEAIRRARAAHRAEATMRRVRTAHRAVEAAQDRQLDREMRQTALNLQVGRLLNRRAQVQSLDQQSLNPNQIYELQRGLDQLRNEIRCGITEIDYLGRLRRRIIEAATIELPDHPELALLRVQVDGTEARDRIVRRQAPNNAEGNLQGYDYDPDRFGAPVPANPQQGPPRNTPVPFPEIPGLRPRIWDQISAMLENGTALNNATPPNPVPAPTPVQARHQHDQNVEARTQLELLEQARHQQDLLDQARHQQDLLYQARHQQDPLDQARRQQDLLAQACHQQYGVHTRLNDRGDFGEYTPARGNTQLPMRPAEDTVERQRSQRTIPWPEILPIQRPRFLPPEQPNPLAHSYQFPNNQPIQNLLYNPDLAAAGVNNNTLNGAPQWSTAQPAPAPAPTSTQTQHQVAPPLRPGQIIDLTDEGNNIDLTGDGSNELNANHPNVNRLNQVTVGGNGVA